MKKLRVGVIYGGRSGEHEVSLASAAAVFQNLDPERYLPVAILIEKDGRWALPARPPAITVAADVINAGKKELGEPSREAHFVAHPGGDTLLTVDRRDEGAFVSGLALDVVFPVLHGPYGEDGTVQGLLELANVPYVGAGVLASAVGMDKAAMKMIFAANNLPICDYHAFLTRDWRKGERGIMNAIAAKLGFPVFVKPANLGSSVGISKVHDRKELGPAMDLAAGFDRKIVIEQGVGGKKKAREIECSVLGNDEPKASVAGEIVPVKEFYDYAAKYLDEGSELLIPAKLSKRLTKEVQEMAVAAFKAVDCAGLARVDFLLDPTTEKLYLNEINTMPGFTAISMYPKLWAASGLEYPKLIDRLIDLAMERHAEKSKNAYSR